MLRAPITRVLFERGRFTSADTVATAEALSGYAVGLVAFAAARITAQAFYAVGRPGVAVRLGILAVAANVLAALALMRPLGHAGLAYASSIGAFVNLMMLLWVARRRFGRLGGRALLAGRSAGCSARAARRSAPRELPAARAACYSPSCTPTPPRHSPVIRFLRPRRPPR